MTVGESDTGATVESLLFDLNRESNTALVVVTHDAELASKCERTIRLRGGRSAEDKARATREMFAALEGFMAPALAKHSIALSIEMRDIDPALSPKTGTNRDHLPATGMAEKES